MAKKNFSGLVMVIFVCGLTFGFATIDRVHAAPSIPKPSIPGFTLKYVDYSYDVPPIYKIDEYTGETVVAAGSYRVKNMTVQVNIRNQHFSHSSNGATYHLYYNVRFRGHFGKGLE